MKPSSVVDFHLQTSLWGHLKLSLTGFLLCSFLCPKQGLSSLE